MPPRGHNGVSAHWDQSAVTREDDMRAFDKLPPAVRRVIADSCVGMNAQQVLQQYTAHSWRPDFRLEHFVLFIAHHDEKSEQDCSLWGFQHTEPFRHPLLVALRKVRDLK